MVAQTLETIDRGLCERFELAWLRDAPQDIQEALGETAADDSLPTLEELIRLDMEYRWRAARISPSDETLDSSPPTVEDYLERFPQMDDPQRVLRLVRKERELRTVAGDSGKTNYSERFPQLAENESAKAFLETVDIARAETVTDTGKAMSLPQLGDFGNYELIEILGEGGMGVVYRARQKDANREVALKVIHSERRGSSVDKKREKAIERFRTEAQAAAKLDHDNIVPVYDVGQVDDQLYFAMRLVEGKSLKEMVEEHPMENRAAAQYLLGAALGMAEAHQQGILHRDLKPHNVMVDGRNDRPMIADFGLAKVIESDDELTRSGEVLGTPSYMPPEQIGDSSKAGTSSDIYSLGATLYHILTGRPPFQAAHTLSTMRQVIYEDPVSPDRLNAEIDRDLNTICLKCLQKEPAQRYASAGDLAEDLQRYLAGEPIHARPISRAERAVRWCRRNPLAAGLSGVAALLAVAVFLSVLIGYQQTNAALAQSEEHFALARETVDELYTEASEIDLKNAPGMQPLKEKLLTRSLKYYERMIAEHEGHADLSAELAMNHYRVGSITAEIGSINDAAEHFVTASVMQQALLAKSPDNEDLLLALGNSHNALGRVRMQAENTAGAKEAFDAAHQIRKQLAEAHPDNVEYQRKLANVMMNEGLLAAREGDAKIATKKYEAAQAIRQKVLKDNEIDDIARDYGKGAFNLGALATGRQDFEQAAKHFRDAIAKFEPLVKKHPESLTDQVQLAVSYFMLADVLQLMNQPEPALEHYATSQARLQMLTDENPRVSEFRERLVTNLMGQAQLKLLMGQAKARQAAEDPEAIKSSQQYYEQAEAVLLQSSRELTSLIRQDPEVASYHYDLAVVFNMLADIQLVFGDKEQAREYVEQAKAAMGPLKDQMEAVPAYQQQWEMLETLADRLTTQS